MDRQFIIDFLINNSKGNANITDALKLFTSYCCEEHNKNVNDTNKFINILMSIGIFSNFLLEVIDYYKKKFNVIEVLDKNGKTILIY